MAVGGALVRKQQGEVRRAVALMLAGQGGMTADLDADGVAVSPSGV